MGNATELLTDVASNALLIGVAGWALGVGSSALWWLFLRKGRARTNHKRAIRALVEQQLPGSANPVYDGERFPFSSLAWGDWSDTARKLAAHLADPRYSEVPKAHRRLLESDRKARGRIDEVLSRYRTAVDSAFGTPAGLDPSDGKFSGEIPRYFPSLFRVVLLQDLRGRIRPNAYEPPAFYYGARAKAGPGSPSHRLMWHNAEIACGSEDQVRSLHEKLGPLLTDPALRAIVSDLETAEAERTKELGGRGREFDLARERVLQLLGPGQRSLQGWCELCPSYLGIDPDPPSAG